MQPAYIRYANQGATRNQPLSSNLIGALAFLEGLGVQAEVFSGGQPGIGTGPHRVGSTRHDHGDAADVFFWKDGRKLDWANPADLPTFQEIVRQGKAAGLTGFGAGPGYMQPGSMHIGFGTPAVWGAGGKGANAPDWLRVAYGQAPQGQTTMVGGSGGDTVGARAEPVGIFQAMQMPEEKRGGLFNLPESTRDRLRMSFAAMSPQNPNSRFIMAQAQQSINDRADRRDKVETANKTAQWLADNGFADLAQGVASGALPGNAALGEALARQRAANAGPDLTTLQKNYQLAVAQGYTGDFMQYQTDLKQAGAANTQVVNNMGNPVEPLGTKGQILVPDPEAPGGYRVDIAPGSELAREIEEKEDKAAQAEQAQTQSASLVMDEIELARELITGQSATSPATGITGGMASVVDSTRAGALKNRLSTIKANIGFDKLQAMRDASPTGGALGQVSEFENRLLQAVFGSLEQSQRAEDLLYNLGRLETIYDRIIHKGIGDDEARAMYKDVVRGAQGGDSLDVAPSEPETPNARPEPPAGVSADEWQQLWEIMTPAERALYQ